VLWENIKKQFKFKEYFVDDLVFWMKSFLGDIYLTDYANFAN